jgi:hypothetical protein
VENGVNRVADKVEQHLLDLQDIYKHRRCTARDTLGLVWQIVQAHPMGYSNLQFGYWSREPVDSNDKRPPLGFITDKLP